ncbi:MAG TPA: hypothetical protein PLD25_21590 [Chloroflexota bacterium]|nr:hypothetical protein [Chloroflexota bacterium]HUM70088.1 hypothetical protein [Chloroflexota bacterium]
MMMMTHTNEEMLAASADMTAVSGVVEVNTPVAVLWECFTQAHHWPHWNACMFWVRNHDLVLGQQLVWAFQPIRRRYLYKLPGIAKIVEVEKNHKVTWEVTAVPGFYARHTYFMQEITAESCRFGSYEKAMGPTFRQLQRFWLAHFMFVKDRSLEGACYLEEMYQATGQLQFPGSLPLPIRQGAK